ncbi:hypothetical protein [Pseudomonas moraviensis]|uniref:hypothetical protein n=1 Tax=Pseudomonas moraviensis TaxID=321662 RepID=UPI001FD1772D|nr:hypothetical protein [Pseudomonas moraviensis]
MSDCSGWRGVGERWPSAVLDNGLRILDPAIFQHLPFASADSTNAAVNGGSISRFGMYAPPTAGQRANVIADRIESHNSSPIWHRESQTELAL